MPNYIKPNIIQKFSGIKVSIWNWFEEEIGNQEGPFEIDQGKLADKFDVSRTSIINALKTFVSANLIEKVSSGRGRGNHSKYKLIWTFKTKSEIKCNPSHVSSNPKRKSLTKESKTYRYFAMKFRQTIQNSNLSDSWYQLSSLLLDYVKGKPKEVAETFLIYLQNWINDRKRTLRDFYVYFHDTLKELAREKLKLEQTNKRIEKQIEQKEQVRKEYKNNPPPRSKDFSHFSDYIKAIKEKTSSPPI